MGLRSLTQENGKILGNQSMRRLFDEQPLNFRTQYAELKERARAAGPLLPGTPGTLMLRAATGHRYWYRVFQSVPGKQSETLVGKDGDEEALRMMRDRLAFAEWVADQVTALRKLGFQVADKSSARVLVELHNLGAFEAGLTLVGTLAYMAWLNDFGAVSVSARTLDVDVARAERLKLAAPLPFLATMQATGLPFTAIPGLKPSDPVTSVKLPGAEGLRVDVLVPGRSLGAVVRVPELQWSAQAIPYYDYLLESPEPAAVLAGWHCIPVRVPQVARMIWHKLYASTRRSDRARAAKDRQQGITLAAALTEQEPRSLRSGFQDASEAMIRPIRPLLDGLVAELGAHPSAAETLRECLSSTVRHALRKAPR
jgi:hypothetical protein